MADDSYTYKNGKFVKRTAEQQRRRDEYFAAAAEAKKPQRMPKRKEAFIQITMKQLDLLIPLLSKSPEVSIFFILCHENFRHHGQAFMWPTYKVIEIGGFSPRAQRRVILILEKRGLISVQRVHKKPPIIRVF
jgi:hypothetical protein